MRTMSIFAIALALCLGAAWLTWGPAEELTPPLQLTGKTSLQ